MARLSDRLRLPSSVFRTVCALCTLLFSSTCGFHSSAESIKNTASALVERIDFDWDHSGKPTRFALSTQDSSHTTVPDILTIQRPGIKPLILENKDGGWGKYAALAPALKHRNLVSVQYMFFIAAGPAKDARIYLILIGEGTGCCVGSLTVMTPNQDGTPKTVFHESQQLLSDVQPLNDASGIQLIAKSSDSEAWAVKNAQSYDPFRVYLLSGMLPAKYDQPLSKTYTEAHYCQWVGPDYNEKYGAIQIANGINNCRTMTRTQFEKYAAKHPARFPQD
jgi:hypothetical protein